MIVNPGLLHEMGQLGLEWGRGGKEKEQCKAWVQISFAH